MKHPHLYLLTHVFPNVAIVALLITCAVYLFWWLL